ncbi:MAG: hypothetical protein GYB33_01380 [Gammaproteobacteria bacterium]|uniref:hypothetical protein n=1 Tax=Pseudomaricurvus alcaniphilus TaxID=1166482 RepID=UPI00140A7409|nr:hypothetical protein [Pseudomaricurvus alcaniphilus]MBR9908985.1 hypothetical protein [Gammaproteobacteria bacterium]NHN38038.1 hypothetical protein [Pseudomaricurvus alcaniphilus]
MNPAFEELEKLIQEKVDMGLFGSTEQAIASIKHWLEEIEDHYIDEDMHNQDA